VTLSRLLKKAPDKSCSLAPACAWSLSAGTGPGTTTLRGQAPHLVAMNRSAKFEKELKS